MAVIKFKIDLTAEEQKQCRDFAEESAKTQREYRSGGSQVRKIYLIISDTRRGKVAEVASKKFLEQSPLNIEAIELDFNIYPRGIWDDQDFIFNGKKVAIKSAKWFSRWLLLESKDINRGDLYDYYILVTVDKDFTEGTLMGWASKDEILNDPKTLKLKRGKPIPRTETPLDADNHARHSNDLHNSEEDWSRLVEILKE